MSVLTYLTETQIEDAAATIQGKTLTRPTLLATDGSALIYVVDVDIGAQPVSATPAKFVTVTTDPGTGTVTTVTTETIVVSGTTTTKVTTVVAVPGSPPSTSVTTTTDATSTGTAGQTILRNVPIARNNRDLIFSDAGSAVTLRRTNSGQYQVIGLANELPGTYTVFSVDLSTFTFGAVRDMTLSARPLTLGELGSLGEFGTIPLGATGLFQGGVLTEIRSQ